MAAIYQSVQGNHPAKNRFDLSHSHFMSMKVGKLYVSCCLEMYPGDVFKVSDAVHCQLQPMVAPLMSDLNLYAHSFFVPYRLIYGVDNLDGKSIWEKYITGGDDGDYDTPLPAWEPTWTKVAFSSDTIWDSIGNPVSYVRTGSGSDLDPYVYTWKPIVPSGLSVSKAPKLAYNFIVNNYYIDENLQDPVDEDNEDLVYADWKKDYFTSALESQQFGTAPAMPVDVHFVHPSSDSGSFTVGYIANRNVNISGSPSLDQSGYIRYLPGDGTPITIADGFVGVAASGGQQGHAVVSDGTLSGYYMNPGELSKGTLAGLVSDASIVFNNSYNPASYLNSAVSGFGFDVAKMRLMFAMQRLMELSLTGGHRYTEYLEAHFGVSPSDARLDRPEYVGGCVFPVNVSVSVQNSETASTPQGNKVGIGNINDVEYVGSYRAEEYGLFMTLISIRPKPCYQQGINRQWLRQNRFMYYSPEMANISENAIYNAELYVDPDDADRPDNGIFGYQAAWNELRAQNNIVSGAMREQFDYWLMSRKFATRPALNADFVSLGHPEEYNRVWAVQDEDQFIVAWSNIIDSYRPLPAFGTPGLIDHVYGGK